MGQGGTWGWVLAPMGAMRGGQGGRKHRADVKLGTWGKKSVAVGL